MSKTIRSEEYLVAGGFLYTSFVQDQPQLISRFPKLNEDYRKGFNQAIEDVDVIEGKMRLTEDQKNTTAALYAEAHELDVELNYLSDHFRDSKFNVKTITAVKNDLAKLDIEDALEKLADLVPYLKANQTPLIEHGMSPTFPDELLTIRTSIADKNKLQNKIMNDRKQLVNANAAVYKNLYDYITNVARKGKIIFKGTKKADEYTLDKIIGRMRAPKRKEVDKPTS